MIYASSDFILLLLLKFWYAGHLMAMSLVQDRSGFPYMAPPLFEYLCAMPTIDVTKKDVPSYEVQQLLQQVFMKSALD